MRLSYNQISQRFYNNPGSLVKLLFFGIILVVLLFILVQYLTTGTVSIHTDHENSVSLTTYGGAPASSQTNGTLNKRLRPGKYLVTVINKSGVVKQTVEVRAHQHSNYTINPVSPATMEPVLPFGVLTLAANKTQMYYLDSNHRLNHILQNGITSPVVNAPAFKSIKWQNPVYGIGLSLDDSNFYKITGGQVLHLNLPFKPTGSSAYDVSPNGNLFIINAKSLYKITPTNQFTKFPIGISDGDNIGEIVAANDSAALLPGNGVDAGSFKSGLSVQIIDSFGKLSGSKKSVPVYEMKWSPDGKLLATTDGSKSTIYDKNLKAISALPEANVKSIAWLDSKTVLYTVRSSLFSYNISDQKIEHLADAGIKSGISQIYTSTDYVYLGVDTVEPSSTITKTIKRISRSHQSAPSYTYGLDIFFPANYPDCHFNYLNFSQPVITVGSYTNNQSCVDAARSEVVQDRLPVGNFNFQYIGGAG